MPGCGAACCNYVVLVIPHRRGWNCNTPQAGFGSLLMVSAHPTASLRLLIQLAMPFGPPGVGSCFPTPFWNPKGRHGVDVFADPFAFESAEILAVGDGGLRRAHHLTFVVHRIGEAVRAAESRCCQIKMESHKPHGRVRLVVGYSRRSGDEPVAGHEVRRPRKRRPPRRDPEPNKWCPRSAPWRARSSEIHPQLRSISYFPLHRTISSRRHRRKGKPKAAMGVIRYFLDANITNLLKAWSAGDPAALNQLSKQV